MAQIKSTFASYRKRINANADVGRKTLTVVYYGGHGMQKDGLSHIVMRDDQNKTPLYNLENSLRAMGAQADSYVIGIFDCCRELYSQSHFKPVEMRNGVGTEEKKKTVKESRNVILIFGCAP